MEQLEALGHILLSSKTTLEAIIGPVQVYKDLKISVSIYTHTPPHTQFTHSLLGF